MTFAGIGNNVIRNINFIINSIHLGDRYPFRFLAHGIVFIMISVTHMTSHIVSMPWFSVWFRDVCFVLVFRIPHQSVLISFMTLLVCDMRMVWS